MKTQHRNLLRELRRNDAIAAKRIADWQTSKASSPRGLGDPTHLEAANNALARNIELLASVETDASASPTIH